MAHPQWRTVGVVAIQDATSSYKQWKTAANSQGQEDLLPPCLAYFPFLTNIIMFEIALLAQKIL